ncbi:protein-glutamine gamma-glutamyltransferase E-like [Leptodactylus fuscus]|uniref:protein-glutamine gamma-glutamyltransferase E-like n=1 Tax=Leptodactylus fuscus TaxID=238119 RepID=UPI003F4EBF6F
MTSLQLSNVDYQQKKNTTVHRTFDYDTKELVTRRGLNTELIFNFNRPVQSGDSFTLTVETGPKPSESSNTRAVMAISSSGSSTTWSATRGSTSGNSMTVNLSCPVNAVIGRYQMKLKTTSGGRTSSSNLESFVVLFNPWASGDEVYIKNEAERAEYVLNDVGLYWVGDWDRNYERRWNYGQFEYDILNICLTLMDKGAIYSRDLATDVSRRNDPLHVGRVLSAMVNSNDNDGGVIMGNWSGNYTGGISPTRWNGSVDILRRWKKDGPVKYGQCWVYAGVLTTVLRCLGIPARVIINFASAHDTNANLIIDNYYDEKGRKLSSRSGDSVWNFHAWVECWSTRRDLGTGFYDGWQILDATPQEQSQGIFCLGPCSQTAVKEGDVDLPYDTPFVFAEVNADTEEWVVYNNGSTKKVYTDPSAVGRNTSTKSVGYFTREDVTNQYKYPEGSAKEREMVIKAKLKMRHSHGAARMSMAAMSLRDAAPEEAAVKPEFSGRINNVETQVGEDLIMKLVLKSTSTKPRRVKVDTTAVAIVYNNSPVGKILTDSQSVMLGPNEEKTISVSVPYPKYKPVLTPDNMISVGAVCEDEMGGKLLVKKVVTLKNPPLMLRVLQEAKLNEESMVDVIFTNPIQDTVSDCMLTLEGSGLLKEEAIVKVPMLKKNQRVTITIPFNPSRIGDKTFLADFDSKSFANVKGFMSVVVASC